MKDSLAEKDQKAQALLEWMDIHFEKHVKGGKLLQYEPKCAFCKEYRR